MEPLGFQLMKKEGNNLDGLLSEKNKMKTVVMMEKQNGMQLHPP